MARPLKKGLDYFPLDTDIDQDDKLLLVEAEHGLEGFAVIIKMMMRIYDHGYYTMWTEREQKIFSRKINADINLVNAVINEALMSHFFHKGLHERHGILTSKGIQERYVEASTRRKGLTFIKQYLLLPEEEVLNSFKYPPKIVNANNNSVNVDNNYTSSGVNNDISAEIRKKETRLNESETTTTEKNQKPQQSPFHFYESNFGNLTQFVGESIGLWVDDLNEEMVIEAMKKALKASKKFNYAEGIMKDWRNNGLKTLEAVQAAEAEFERSKGGYKGNGSSRGSYQGDPEELKPKNTVGKTVEQLMREMQ